MVRVRRKGFTLIELLVVIAIIALLISILLPSLGAAREQAKRVKCLANMKGFGTTSRLFANNHDGRIPWGQQSYYPSPTPNWWPSLYAADFVDLAQNYGSENAFHCPSAEYAPYQLFTHFGAVPDKKDWNKPEYAAIGGQQRYISYVAGLVADGTLLADPDPHHSWEHGWHGNLEPDTVLLSYVVTDYSFYGATFKRQGTPGTFETGQTRPWQVYKVDGRSYMSDVNVSGHNLWNLTDDRNPVIISDMVWSQGFGIANHARNFRIVSQGSVNPPGHNNEARWGYGTYSGQVYEGRGYMDGHAEMQQRGERAFFYTGGSNTYWW